LLRSYFAKNIRAFYVTKRYSTKYNVHLYIRISRENVILYNNICTYIQYRTTNVARARARTRTHTHTHTQNQILHA